MCSVIRVCADPHFGHTNMAIKRGFRDVFEHDEKIVDNWNSIVNKRDVTYILGDITMEKRTNYDILDRLKGIKVAVLGNHDDKNHVRSLLEHVDHVAGCIKMKVAGKTIFLTHVPVHPMEFDYRLDYNIHGHIHDLTVKNINGKIWIDDKRYICVSMEQINYKPVELNSLVL